MSDVVNRLMAALDDHINLYGLEFETGLVVEDWYQDSDDDLVLAGWDKRNGAEEFVIRLKAEEER
jgi:hypothetical protein